MGFNSGFKGLIQLLLPFNSDVILQIMNTQGNADRTIPLQK